MDVHTRLGALRRTMRKHRIDAYFVPNADPHQSEYAPECWERRAWMSGFTGSAGDLLVGKDEAWLWTDGRYFLQAERQLDGSGITLMRQGVTGVPSVEGLLKKTLRKRRRLGVDPRVVTPARARSLAAALADVGAELVLVDDNLVDAVWTEQPDSPASPMMVLENAYAGESVANKLKRVRGEMRERGADAMVVTMLDAIAWLFNIRAQDVAYNPVAVAYAVVTLDHATLFTNLERMSGRVRRHLGNRVTMAPYADTAAELQRLGRRKATVWLDESSASRWVLDQVAGADVVSAALPIGRMKARKNATELSGMRAAHVRDGVAMVRFLFWLEEAVPAGGQTELTVATQLEAFRSEGEHFQGLSFPTIAGYKEHGAIIHYGVTAASAKKLRPQGIFLLDSGAQYLDGTTDITRTLLLGGRATRAQKRNYTLVLKGHIALATARFPAGATGARLDTFARQYLWAAGLDYAHGTGHGVGAFLNVHEGPQSISPRSQSAPLEVGNIQSNEPGFYEPGAYGIRIENLVEVVQDTEISSEGQSFLGFDTLTLCPIDTQLVDVTLLSDVERQWLNRYHRRVRKTLTPLLRKPERTWLAKACARI